MYVFMYVCIYIYICMGLYAFYAQRYVFTFLLWALFEENRATSSGPPSGLVPPPCRGGPYFPNKSPVFPLFVTVWGTGVRIFTSGAANHWITGKFSLLIIGLLSLETPLAC